MNNINIKEINNKMKNSTDERKTRQKKRTRRAKINKNETISTKWSCK